MGYGGRPIGDINPRPQTRGDYMRNARLRIRMSQKKLAEKSGISPTTIGAAESDQVIPHLDTIELLADALGISIDEYVGHKVESRTR